AEAWLARWAAQESLVMAENELALVMNLQRSMHATLAAGEATRVDMALIDVWGAEAELLRLSAEGQAFASGVELSRATGQEGEMPLRATGELPEIDLPGEPALRTSLAHLNTSPQVAAARAARRAHAARLAEVRAS